ncbi:MAG: hypothetical protein HYZ28_03395, partial [Myxococcales bacterium]|nr:hypothetical protein [Myxococcales bacterium]
MARLLCASAALLLASTSSAAVADGVSFLLRHQSPSGAFGESTAEEPTVATFEALATLRELGLSGTAEAQNAEGYLASSKSL